jgi:hypothetical protein
MESVYLDMEKLEVETSLSLTSTFKELARHYKGNPTLLNCTFPLIVSADEEEALTNQFVGREDGLNFYTFYPWKYVLIDAR